MTKGSGKGTQYVGLVTLSDKSTGRDHAENTQIFSEFPSAFSSMIYYKFISNNYRT